MPAGKLCVQLKLCNSQLRERTKENTPLCAVLYSSFEAYFYDLEAVDDEADDPLKAVLCHWPLGLSDEHVVLVAGHLVRHFRASHFYLSEDPIIPTVFGVEQGCTTRISSGP